MTLKNGQIGFAPEGLEKGQLAGMIFWPEESATGDLKAWFQRKAPAMGAKGGAFSSIGGIVLTTGVSNGRPFILAAARPKGSTERARVGMLTADADIIKNYSSDFTALLVQYSTGKAPEGSPTPKASSTDNRKAKPDPDPRWANLPASNPAKPLPAASLNGAKVYIVYRNSYGLSGMTVTTDPMILFPDGTAFSDGPNKPVAAFDAAHLKGAVSRFDVGRWSLSGNRLTTTFPLRKSDPTTVYRKVGESWTDDKEANANSAWNVYRRAVPGTIARLQGEWRTSSLSTMGGMGGGTPMVASGSSGTLVFKGDRFANSSSSFASATTANMGDAFKSGGDVSTYSNRDRKAGGRYRLDGILLTREVDGKRGIELCFLMPHYDGDVPKTFFIGGSRYGRPERD